jgi:hypothetical protein
MQAEAGDGAALPAMIVRVRVVRPLVEQLPAHERCAKVRRRCQCSLSVDGHGATGLVNPGPAAAETNLNLTEFATRMITFVDSDARTGDTTGDHCSEIQRHISGHGEP